MANVVSTLGVEIDLATADAFRSDLYHLIDRSDLPTVHVDLAAVTFMDSAGYHALVDANEYATRRHRVMAIHNLAQQCARVIQLCDSHNELHVESFVSDPHTEELPVEPHTEGAHTESFGLPPQRGISSSGKPVRERAARDVTVPPGSPRPGGVVVELAPLLNRLFNLLSSIGRPDDHEVELPHDLLASRPD